MTSPDVFRSSPRKASRRESYSATSSSPDLPPLQDLLSQSNAKPPQFKPSLNSKARSKNALTNFQSARDFWKSAQTTGSSLVDLVANEHDTSASIVEVAAKSIPEGHKPTQDTNISDHGEEPTEATVSSNDRSWEKYRPKAVIRKEELQENGHTKQIDKNCRQGLVAKESVKKTGLTSSHFKAVLKPRSTSKVQATLSEKPLFMEQAVDRKMDWTPPKESPALLASSALDPATILDASLSERSGSRGVFENLKVAYACQEVQDEPSVIVVDEHSSFTKKRKLVGMVELPNVKLQTSVTDEVIQPRLQDTAPKKKARTITELATSAYRSAPKLDLLEAPPASRLHYVIHEDERSTTTTDTEQAKGKQRGKRATKAKAPKKTTKATGKKVSLRPFLLSPSTALKQTTAQDFVFGTSSQLVREESPTFLRDLQTAMKKSNEIEGAASGSTDDSSSDANVQSSKLWYAGARDTDGELFDVSFIDLVATSAEVHEAINVSGVGSCGTKYGTKETPHLLPIAQAALVLTEDPFDESSNVQVPAVGMLEGLNEDESSFSSSQISVSTNVGKRAAPATVSMYVSAETVPDPVADEQIPQATIMQTSRVDYEGFTDAQLSVKVAAFGFKPVKRRAAMIALLNQCQQSTTAMSLSGTRAVSTSTRRKSKTNKVDIASSPKPKGRQRKESNNEQLVIPHTSPLKATELPKKPRGLSKAKASAVSTAAKPVADPATSVSPKRSPGRPKKNSSSSSPVQVQEPPPSAQPSGSPRGPGRPKKNTPSPTGVSPSKAKALKKSKGTAAPLPRTPKRNAAAFKAMVEIPDSSSEYGSDAELSSSSSTDFGDSPSHTVDMSVSVEGDDELSLMVGATDQDTDLFGYITKAVKAARRTNDPLNPSWHEKMLMYDPIIVEDLAVWLNAGRLDKVGYDGEVKPAEVKKWCESKSVCCLWRVNYQGRERKRY